MHTILIIEDDVSIGNMLEETLVQEGYRILRAYSGTEALLVVASDRPDIVLLDLMLPGLSGEEVLKQIKDIPVIVVSAKINIDDKVNVLLDGAVDYITKPYNMKELLARIKIRLRNDLFTANSKLRFENIILDLQTHSVTLSGESLKFTRTEYAILKLLMQNPAQVITKTVLLDRISLDTPDCTDSSLKIHVSNIRKKLRDVSGKDYIEAVWGIGFKLREQ